MKALLEHRHRVRGLSGAPKPKTAIRAAHRDPRWKAILSRDPRADGTFYYAVDTTGVYCRPSCPSRQARPEHVRFYATPAEAEVAGYRACRRCRPSQPTPASRLGALVTEACRLLESSEHLPSLGELASRAGISKYHFHRLFKACTGVTPRAYAAAHRSRRVQAELLRCETVTAAMFEAGYGSTGRFYEVAGDVLGMTPSAYRAGGARTKIRFAVGVCSLGAILVACSVRGVCAIALGDDPEELIRDLEQRFPRAHLIGGDAGFDRLVAMVVGFVEAPHLGFSLPLDIRGTAFQQRVWEALRKIPAGTRMSYGELAARIGAPTAVRAVARACGANPLAVAIPCHRVVQKDGRISGYRWGIECKRTLLEREASG